ncbi:MAG: cysteine dioxygenase [Bacteroidia bacterium]
MDLYDNRQKQETKAMNSNTISPQTIETLDALVTALTEGERTTFQKIIHSANMPISDFDTMCSWSEDTYTRNCIACSDQFELILLCWDKGQMTPIHDHGGEECWVRIIDGKFKETIYQETDSGDPELERSILTETGDVTYMIDFMGCHRIENVSGRRGMSLHLYAKPIATCNIYDEEKASFILKKMSYDTVAENAHS